MTNIKGIDIACFLIKRDAMYCYIAVWFVGTATMTFKFVNP